MVVGQFDFNMIYPDVLRISSPLTKRLSIDAETPSDELRVSGKSPLKSIPQPLRLSLSKPRFGENRQSLGKEGQQE
jgi:hypothetical protein